MKIEGTNIINGKRAVNSNMQPKKYNRASLCMVLGLFLNFEKKTT